MMFSRLCFLFLPFLTQGYGKLLPSLDVSRLSDAIRLCENTSRETIGSNGERSEWQISRNVWYSYTTLPFEWASRAELICREETDRVVRRHIRWIVSRLDRLGLPPTAYSVALVYNAGYGNVRKGTFLSRSEEYAQRAQNLYDDL